jgi:hypothetical protein
MTPPTVAPYSEEGIEAIRRGLQTGKPDHSPRDPYTDISVIGGLLATLDSLKAEIVTERHEHDSWRRTAIERAEMRDRFEAEKFDLAKELDALRAELARRETEKIERGIVYNQLSDEADTLRAEAKTGEKP